jgi:type II secretory pathway component PulF
MRNRKSRSDELAEGEAARLAERLAVLSSTELPLPSGLRRAADQVLDEKLRGTMQSLADRLEQGEGVDTAVRDQLARCPASLRGALTAALNTEDVGGVLSEFIDQHRMRREIQAAIRSTLAYPILLLSFCFVVVVVFSIYVMPGIASSLEFLVWGEQDGRIVAVRWWSQSGVWYLIGALVLAFAGAILYRSLAGAVRWQKAKERIPLFGPLFHWIGVVEWARMMSLLLRREILLTQAVDWASQSSSDASIRQLGPQLVEDLKNGQSLSAALDRCGFALGVFALLVGWGERMSQLAQSLETAAQHYQDRLDSRLAMLRLIIPPMLFSFIAFVVFLMFGSIIALLRSVMYWLA